MTGLEMEVCVFTARRSSPDSGGKFLAIHPDAAVQLGQRWDEGRINWHSGGERKRNEESQR